MQPPPTICHSPPRRYVATVHLLCCLLYPGKGYISCGRQRSSIVDIFLNCRRVSSLRSLTTLTFLVCFYIEIQNILQDTETQRQVTAAVAIVPVAAVAAAVADARLVMCFDLSTASLFALLAQNIYTIGSCAPREQARAAATTLTVPLYNFRLPHTHAHTHTHVYIICAYCHIISVNIKRATTRCAMPLQLSNVLCVLPSPPLLLSLLHPCLLTPLAIVSVAQTVSCKSAYSLCLFGRKSMRTRSSNSNSNSNSSQVFAFITLLSLFELGQIPAERNLISLFKESLREFLNVF